MTTSLAERARVWNDRQMWWRNERRRDLLDLIDIRGGSLTCIDAQTRLGVCERTINRYIRELKADGCIVRANPHSIPVRWKITETGWAELNA